MLEGVSSDGPDNGLFFERFQNSRYRFQLLLLNETIFTHTWCRAEFK
jgi:hypothetical protein